MCFYVTHSALTGMQEIFLENFQLRWQVEQTVLNKQNIRNGSRIVLCQGYCGAPPYEFERRRVWREVEDDMIWTRLKNAKFSIKALYLDLELGCTISFPAGVIWNSWVLLEVDFFAWEATWAKVLTLDHLKKESIDRICQIVYNYLGYLLFLFLFFPYCIVGPTNMYIYIPKSNVYSTLFQ